MSRRKIFQATNFQWNLKLMYFMTCIFHQIFLSQNPLQVAEHFFASEIIFSAHRVLCTWVQQFMHTKLTRLLSFVISEPSEITCLKEFTPTANRNPYQCRISRVQSTLQCLFKQPQALDSKFFCEVDRAHKQQNVMSCSNLNTSLHSKNSKFWTKDLIVVLSSCKSNQCGLVQSAMSFSVNTVTFFVLCPQTAATKNRFSFLPQWIDSRSCFSPLMQLSVHHSSN